VAEDSVGLPAASTLCVFFLLSQPSC
jgi:hypothetical protein